MVKLSLLVAVGAIGAALALPLSEEVETIVSERELQTRQGGIFATVLGQIGTSLVPLVGAILGPILTNLASGIAGAFNSGLNPAAATPSKEESAGSEDPSDILVRIPPDSPLYALLIAHRQSDKDGLPSVGPQAAHAANTQKPPTLGGKFAAVFRPDSSDPAPVIVDDGDSDVVDSSDEADDVEDEVVNPHVKRYPQRVRTETEYARRR